MTAVAEGMTYGGMPSFCDYANTDLMIYWGKQPAFSCAPAIRKVYDARDRGAKAVYAAISHAPITDEGIEKLRNSGIAELVTTDSVPPKDWRGFPVKILSIAELLGEAILRIHNDQSVSSLFKIQ